MIEIEKSLTADSRTAEYIINKEELISGTKQHISDVQKALSWFASKLKDAGEKHDWSKLEYIDEYYDNFNKSQIDKKYKFKDGTWFNKHIQERHHLTDRCPDDVNLIDVLERVSDICMAGMARSGYIYDDTLSGEILKKAYSNTIKMLTAEIVVEDDAGNSLDESVVIEGSSPGPRVEMTADEYNNSINRLNHLMEESAKLIYTLSSIKLVK